MTQPTSPTVVPPPVRLDYASAGGAGLPVFRDGNLLVAAKGALLPDRCIKCGGPITAPQIRKKLNWTHPLSYLGLLGGLLPFVIVALILQKKGVLQIGVCDRHRRRRVIMIIVCWLMGALSIGLFFLAAAVENGYYVLAGFIIILAALVCAALTTPLVRVKKIDEYYIYLKAVPAEYLDILPPPPRFDPGAPPPPAIR